MSTTRFTHPPGAVLGAAAIVSAVAVVVLAGSSSPLALAVGVFGLVGVATGILRSDRRISTYGVLGLLACVVVAGAEVTPPRVLLPATAAALLSLDFASGSFGAKDELAGGTVERAEVVHVFTATGVGATGTVVAYVLYQTLSVGVSFAGVALLLVAAAALGVALRD